MRTDDFEGPPSQDTNDQRPDAEGVDRDTLEGEGDGFNEFDMPAGGQTTASGSSLGEIWRNNPMIKIAVVGVGVVAVVMGLVMFGGDDDEGLRSKVGMAPQRREAPGGETTEAYRDAVNEVNQQRLDQAMRTGESTMPIPVSTPDTTPPYPAEEAPPVELEDPLKDWRAGTQQAVGPEPTLDPSSPQFQQQQGTPQPMGPDPAAVDALAQAMSSQMQSILDKHKIAGPHVMSVTDRDYYARENTVGPDIAEPTIVREILIPAGTIVYAQTLTESNTDAPGPVLARISSGPLTGSRILGTFNDTDEYLRLEFNTIVIDGISQSANAVALDPKTTLPAVATEVDRRYWRRVIFPMAARFIEGMGDAIAQREQTVVVSDGGTTTASQPDLDTTQELAAGLASGTRELGQELDREANRTKVMIKVHAGTPIGILFLEPVFKEQDSRN